VNGGPRVGILGGGQLGRMLALAGYPLGLTFRFLDNDAAPAGYVGQLITGEFEDEGALDALAAGCEVVTYEFENVPVAAARYLERKLPVCPPSEALAVAQDRLNEKTLFTSLGIPTPEYFNIATREDLTMAVAAAGLPAVLKTRRMGYDGKGQAVLRSPDDLDAAWSSLGSGEAPLILESFVRFDRELSIIVARSRTGELASYPLAQNEHAGGILRVSIAPAPLLPPSLQAQAEHLARAVVEALDYVGVLAIELFQCGDRLLANEMAPRVHNSGHWSIEGAATSQFENHLRAILGLPLGSTSPLGHSAMLNLIGDAPPLAEMLAIPGCHAHLYGKSPRPGRKVGHITLCDADPRRLLDRLADLRARVGQ
jgi:5-(carboxyamino)imidazole ribonucleotide synthase